MSRRDREQRRMRARVGGDGAPPRPPDPGTGGAPGTSLRERFERASIPARALLPLRFFFGVTFLYAGIDKILDPAFFDASNPASIVAQMALFVRESPLSPLVRVAEPFAIPLGILIALAEIAIGIGAITGLAFRLAATGGALLSLMFWLTASWTTQPYYFGPDLPYALGWVTLALAGDGGLLVPRAVREIGMPEEDDWPGTLRGAMGYRPRGGVVLDPGPSPARRQLLQAGVLGVFALAVASAAVPARLVRGAGRDDLTAGSTSGGLAGAGTPPATGPTGQPSPTDAQGATPPAAPTTDPAGAGAAGLAIAKISDVDSAGARGFRVPASAPAPLPAGDPGVIVRLADGTYVAYDATCTHEGCRVGWDAVDGVLLCPCHGAAFDPSDHGAVLGGPTRRPLLELPIDVNHQAGTITLRA
jgi:thiosulfate dehydrogenase [quinone] large subunit